MKRRIRDRILSELRYNEKMKIQSNLWFENEQKAFFGKGRIRLLEEIGRHGSISKAAKAMGMSYKAAWDAVNEMNNLSPSPIVERVTGGKGGGGTRLTPKGEEYIRIYREIDALQRKFFERLGTQGERLEDILTFGRRLTLQTSARNQYSGTVTALETTPLASEVTLRLSGGENLHVTITRESARRLEVAEGETLFALIKSTWVDIVPLSQCKAAKNMLAGTIVGVEEDGTRAEITLALKGENSVTASMAADRFRELGLQEGDRAYACFEASQILLAR